MTNKERYKQAFSALQTFGKKSLEVADMAMIQKKHRKNIAAAAAAMCAAFIGVSGTVYAADIGGIQEKVSIWVYGKEEKVVITENGDGGYTLRYGGDGDNQGVTVFGGVAIGEDANGNASERWLSADEIVVSINQTANVAEDADGRVWVYYYDQKADVTDLFDKEGICKVSLTHEGQTIYLEIERGEDGAYPYSQTNDLPKDSERYTPVGTQKAGEDASGFQPDTKADSLPEAERAKSADTPAVE